MSPTSEPLPLAVILNVATRKFEFIYMICIIFLWDIADLHYMYIAYVYTYMYVYIYARFVQYHIII